MQGLQIRLVYLRLNPNVELNSLTTIDTLRLLGGAEVTHRLWVQEVLGSIPCSGKSLSVGFFLLNTVLTFCLKLMPGKALRKHSLYEKTAASVLLKLFISRNEWCHTTDAP